MDPFVSSGLNITVHATRKRSRSRRPRSDQQLLFEGYSVTPPSDNTLSSDNGSKRSSDSGSYDGSMQKKEYNNSTLNVSSVNRIGVSTSSMRTLKDDTTSSEYDSIYRNGSMRDALSQHSDHEKSKSDLKRCNIGKVKEISEIVPKLSDNLAKSGVGHQVCISNVPGENRLRKVKLKMGGVTHTIHTKSNLDSVSGDGLSDGTQNKQKYSIQQNITLSPEPVRKSKRVPKKRVLDGESDEEEDDEIRYLERLKRSKAGLSNLTGSEFDPRDAMPKKKNSKTNKVRKVHYEEDNEDTDYVEEEEHGSDVGSETKRRNDKPLVFNDGRKEMTLTTRQRALQSSKDGSGGNGSSLIEFPDGLPPAPPRRQKEKLTEVEQQLKKAEAAQRRRLQVEKTARESEAEAIRKILGQDSSRKKREDKFRKKREEVAKEKAANSMIVASDMVRWVMGPTGTTVIFPEDPGLPNILKSKPCSYPPPREKCAGPSCTNAYKYRDSKSNLPLCSLQCYKAIQ